MSRAQLEKISQRNLAFSKDYSKRGNERRVVDPFVDYMVVSSSRKPINLGSNNDNWIYHEKMKGININSGNRQKRRYMESMSNGNKLEHREPNSHDTRGYRIG